VAEEKRAGHARGSKTTLLGHFLKRRPHADGNNPMEICSRQWCLLNVFSSAGRAEAEDLVRIFKCVKRYWLKGENRTNHGICHQIENIPKFLCQKIWLA